MRAVLRPARTVLLVVALLAACRDATPITETASTTTTGPTTTVVPSSSTTATSTTRPARRAVLRFGGDVLIHHEVWGAAATPTGYDFGPMLAPVAPLLTEADLAICHLEVTLARPQDALSGYPRFRAPRTLPADLAAAGFDGCSTASNHALDYGEQGVVSTLSAMDDAKIQHVGTARSAAERAVPAWYQAGGIRIAQLSYSFGFNGLVRPAAEPWLANLIDPATIIADAQSARRNGAEVVVVSLHWGSEYAHEVTPAQQQVADALAAQPGLIDLVVGSHAHVVQPISKVGSMWVIWGMGNFLSNNDPGCCDADVTDGVVVTVTIGDRGVLDVGFSPTWNERQHFRVLPIARTLAGGDVDPALAAAMRASFARTSAHILALGGADLGVAPDDPLP